MIEDEIEPTEPSPEFAAEGAPAEKRTKSPWKAFILTGLIASLFGAAGGGYGVYEGVKRLGPKTAQQPAVDMSPLESKLDALSTRVTAAEASANKAANRPVPKMETVDLSALEARLKTLESAPVPEIDPAALTALQSAQADGFEWPDTSDLEERLAGLELKVETASEISGSAELPEDLLERLKAIEVDMESMADLGEGTAANQTKALDLERMGDIESRLAALEKRPATAARIERVSILAFPKAAMIEVVENSVEGGLFKKTLSKHIRVKDDDDPITLIDGIEVDIEDGRLEDAIKKYDRLPEPIRAAGQAWHDSVKASL